MARRPRFYATGMPYHIVQRGNNRSLCFYEPSDQRHYLELFAKVCLKVTLGYTNFLIILKPKF